MTTDAQGNYFFDNLVPGQYVVGVEAPYEAPTSSTDIATTNADNQTDGDDNGLQTSLGDEAKSPVITLLPGSEPFDVHETAQGGDQETGADSSGDMTVDFGFAPPVSIGSTVFFDSNNNGVQDETEIGISDVTVTLYQEDGTSQVAQMQTGASGDYFFGNLVPGKYIVSVEAQTSAPTSSQDIATSNADNQVDSDDNGIQASAGEDAQSPVITLIAGERIL